MSASAWAGAPVLSVEGFEGPLDWLLELARARRIDLATLSIAALVEGFAAALETALGERMALDRWADWVVMAATLALLRSRLMLPDDDADADDARDAAEALRRRLLDRAAIGTAVAWLERRPQLGRDCFPRGLPAAAAAGPRAGDLTDLLRACLAALRLPDEADRLYRPRPPPLWQVPDAMARIRSLLVTLPDGAALLACLPAIAPDAAERDLRCRAAVASTLVAGLEMARGEALVLEQEGAFTVIRCRKAKGATPGPRQSRSLGT